MIRDVFYYGEKPNVHPREKFAVDINDARQQATTEHFWIINNLCDYTGFDWDWDFDFLPDEELWMAEHNNVWPSPYQSDSGTWLCPKQHSDTILYRADVSPVPKKHEVSKNWENIEHIDVNQFDFGWHPDPMHAPRIYQFGTQWQQTGGPRYVVPGATVVKYVDDQVATRLPTMQNWDIPSNVILSSFDFSWNHNEFDDKPYIYQFGTQWQRTGGPRYVVPGATQVKYINSLTAKVLPSNFENWLVPKNIDKSTFDFSWHPDDTEPPFIYQFSSNWDRNGGPRYVVPGATQVKYIDFPKAKALPDMTHWVVPPTIDRESFDFSWHPNKDEPPFVYQFPTQWQKTGGPKFIAAGATEKSPVKYIDILVSKRLPSQDNWETLIPVDDFDYSWHPDDTEPAFIYVFGNQWNSCNEEPTVRYVVPGATQVKYMTDIIAKVKPEMDRWKILHEVEDFDFSWRPDPKEPAFIYVWGNQWNDATIDPTVELHMPGATQRKYMTDRVARVKPNLSKWKVFHEVVDFDYSWLPNPTEPPFVYVFGNEKHDATRYSTLEYHVEGATQKKYMTDIVAKLKIDMSKWVIADFVESFDYSWIPDPEEPPFIYVFGNKWNDAMTEPSVEYHVPGATQKKYITDIVATTKSNRSNWKVPLNLDVSNFDFSWRPNPTEPPFIYQFGTQWQKTNGPQYLIPGASQIKYVDVTRARRLPDRDMTRWHQLIPVTSFDYSWHPDETEDPFIYVFGNKWNDVVLEPTLEYRMPGATQKKYITDVAATTAPIKDAWKDTYAIEKFDYSWRPSPMDPPFIYQFGTQWAKTHGPKFVVEGATETKFVEYPTAIIKPSKVNWEIPNDIDVSKFDFSWHPDATSPPYIYQFGTLLDKNDGPRYIVPGNDGTIVYQERKEVNLDELDFPKYPIKTTLENLINEHIDEIFWAINPDLDYSDFDFKWVPDKDNVYHVNAFGSKDNINTQTYFVNGKMWQQGYRDINYIQEKIIDVKTKIDIFFVDRGNSESQERFNKLKERFGNIHKTRYLNSWVDTINRCINKSTTNLCWILNSELDYSNFEFDFYPSPWQMKMVHVFGTQWSHWGTTFIVNKTTFPDDTKYVKVIEHLSNINFVKRKPAFATNCLYDVVVIDHNNKETQSIVDSLKQKVDKQVTIVPYNNDYLDTFKDILKIVGEKKEHYIWVCSSICNYSGFDFSYICDPFAREQLHVFPSNDQKFGDTFLVDVNKLKSLVNNLETLEGYDKVNFNSHQRVSRLPAPIIITNDDTHCESVHQDFDFPYAVFKTNDNKEIDVVDKEPIALWSKETKNIVVTSEGGTRIIVPKEAKNSIKRELYDYPYIIKYDNLTKSMPLDIVFLSNGEKGADENYEHLLKVTKGLPNRIVRVDGVNGRVAAYHAAASASNTPWMFTVFAKLKVDEKFDWNWQPDRMQVPKHYIFYATNPVNGLKYGHQAMIAYNKKITLANTGTGLDFTMDNEHEVVQLNSGTAVFNTDEWSTWRTAFREAIKLKHDTANISKYRLMRWTSKATGDFAQYSLDGANHAVQYYEEVNGDMDKLKLSYDWPWLRAYFESKYK